MMVAKPSASSHKAGDCKGKNQSTVWPCRVRRGKQWAVKTEVPIIVGKTYPDVLEMRLNL